MARASSSSKEALIRRGLNVAHKDIYDENAIWMRHSSDKVNIGHRLMMVLRTLARELPLQRKLTALSLGCGSEPQFRILEAAARGGLYLLDVDQIELDAVEERERRQSVDHVTTIRADFDRVFIEPKKTATFVKRHLKGKRTDLITLHHSLYYCTADQWGAMVGNLYGKVLAPRGAIHAVLMASKSDDPMTTTWLYNHFAGKFFGVHNDQDLNAFARGLRGDAAFRKAQVISRTDEARFLADDFQEFMAVIWMIMLYPQVHNYTPAQRREITEHVYEKFWRRKKPLIQMQDHMAIYRGMGGRGVL